MKPATRIEVLNQDLVAVLVSWQIGLTHQPYKLRNGVNGTVRGFESRTHRQNSSTPTTALTAAGAEIRTAEAVQTFQSHYRPSSVRSQGDFTDDVPQLPDRSQTLRKAPQRPPALSLRSMRQDLHRAA